MKSFYLDNTKSNFGILRLILNKNKISKFIIVVAIIPIILLLRIIISEPLSKDLAITTIIFSLFSIGVLYEYSKIVSELAIDDKHFYVRTFKKFKEFPFDEIKHIVMYKLALFGNTIWFFIKKKRGLGAGFIVLSNTIWREAQEEEEFGKLVEELKQKVEVKSR